MKIYSPYRPRYTGCRYNDLLRADIATHPDNWFEVQLLGKYVKQSDTKASRDILKLEISDVFCR